MYLSNTNILQSRPVLGRGIARGGTSPNATINWTFLETGANGNLIISGGADVNATTSSTGTFTAIPGTIVSSSLVGIGWPTGSSISTIMNLTINGSDYSFAGSSSVSSSKVMAAFTASANQIYSIMGYVSSSVIPQPGTGTYAFGFAKGGAGGTTFTYVDNTNTSQSFFLGEELTSSVDSPFIFDTTIGISAPGAFAQIWSSPYTSSFITGSSLNCKTTTFTNPNPAITGQNFYLAAYIPCNSTTYSFRIVKPSGSYQDCVSYLNDAYMSPGGTYNLDQQYITTGSAC